MITSVIITTTGLTLPWRRERLQAVKRKRTLAQVAGLYPWQDSAVCIIATTSLPERQPRKSPFRVNEELREWCARRPPDVHLAVFSSRFEVTASPRRSQESVENPASSSRVRPFSGPGGLLARRRWPKMRYLSVAKGRSTVDLRKRRQSQVRLWTQSRIIQANIADFFWSASRRP